MNPRRHDRGFTLLELLVATAVFAVLSTLAYSGLHVVLQARDDTARQARRLQEVQTVLSMLEQELAQAAVRSIRDENGEMRPAVVGGAEMNMLEFTRAGWANPAELTRSNLQRVAYGYRDGELRRASWRVLDRAQDSAATQSVILTEVKAWQLRFLDRDRVWREEWPPLGGGVVTPLPLAVEVNLELRDWGLVRRLLRLPGTGA